MDILDDAIEIAQAAGQKLKEIFCEGKRNAYELKADSSYISRADIESHVLIKEALHQRFPHHGILSEEDEYFQGREGDSQGKREGPAGTVTDGCEQERYLWVVDPLDGTSNFIHGIPYFNVAIACVRLLPGADGVAGYECLVGVVFHPIRDELYYAEKGQGAYKILGGQKYALERLQSVELRQSFVSCGFHGESMDPLYDSDYTDFIRIVKNSRRMGSAALDVARTAEGVFDLFFDPAVKVWDTVAASLMLTEVGGVCLPFPSSSVLSLSSPTIGVQGPQQVQHGRFSKSPGIICGVPQAAQQAYDFFYERMRSREPS